MSIARRMRNPLNIKSVAVFETNLDGRGANWLGVRRVITADGGFFPEFDSNINGTRAALLNMWTKFYTTQHTNQLDGRMAITPALLGQVWTATTGHWDWYGKQIAAATGVPESQDLNFSNVSQVVSAFRVMEKVESGENFVSNQDLFQALKLAYAYRDYVVSDDLLRAALAGQPGIMAQGGMHAILSSTLGDIRIDGSPKSKSLPFYDALTKAARLSGLWSPEGGTPAADFDRAFQHIKKARALSAEGTPGTPVEDIDKVSDAMLRRIAAIDLPAGSSQSVIDQRLELLRKLNSSLATADEAFNPEAVTQSLRALRDVEPRVSEEHLKAIVSQLRPDQFVALKRHDAFAENSAFRTIIEAAERLGAGGVPASSHKRAESLNDLRQEMPKLALADVEEPAPPTHVRERPASAQVHLS